MKALAKAISTIDAEKKSVMMRTVLNVQTAQLSAKAVKTVASCLKGSVERHALLGLKLMAEVRI